MGWWRKYYLKHRVKVIARVKQYRLDHPEWLRDQRLKRNTRVIVKKVLEKMIVDVILANF